MFAFGMAASAVTQIAGLITTYELQGEVSELTLNLEAMGTIVEVNARMAQEALQKLGTMVTQNAEFDQIGQIISLIRLEG